MNLGDLVRTKVPGFGTGKESRVGTIIDISKFLQYNKAGVVLVMHDNGSVMEWYPWQLQVISNA